QWNTSFSTANATVRSPPSSAPPTVLIPPTTARRSTGRLCSIVKSDAVTTTRYMPKRAPASPASAADSAKTATFVASRFTPVVAQRREGHQHPERHREGDGEQDPQRRPATDLRHGEGADADEGHLGQRHLTGPAGERHERKHHEPGDDCQRQPVHVHGRQHW